MSASPVEQVRSFNRLVTQRVGALQDHYLSRRPLGEARALWEIGPAGCDVRTLRARLDLDSGYVSRLLRSLEADGLVRVEPSERDRRVRTVRLTQAGCKEREILDQRSDALAHSMLDPLSASQRERLVAAMSVVERLLTSAMVEIEVVDPARPEARFCMGEYFAELDRRFEDGFVPPTSIAAELDGLRLPTGAFLLATLHGEPVGCGLLVVHDPGWAELKRIWVSPMARGIGLGRRLLESLEQTAASAGASIVRLDTNRVLTEAIALYRSAGYEETEPFGDETYAHHWFEKSLQPKARNEG